VSLAGAVGDAGGATLIPAFTGLGAPHWDREAHALISGLTPSTSRAQLARAAVEAVAHQICDVVDVMEAATGPLRTFRADGGASAANLLMQTQADLLNRTIDIADVAEVSALGAARLGWAALGHADRWQPVTAGRRFTGHQMSDETRQQHRRRWADEIARARFRPTTIDGPTAADERA
jgi:glycerol kinase